MGWIRNATMVGNVVRGWGIVNVRASTRVIATRLETSMSSTTKVGHVFDAGFRYHTGRTFAQSIPRKTASKVGQRYHSAKNRTKSAPTIASTMGYSGEIGVLQ